MKKAYHLGTIEKHRLDVAVYWYLGIVVIKLDGKTILRKTFLFKIRESFSVGKKESHFIKFEFNLFDYFKNKLHVSVDGQKMTQEHEILSDNRVDTPADSAAAALFFVAGINVLFAVIGTVFVPYLDTLHVRILLLAGSFFYLFFALQFILAHKIAATLGLIFFLFDSIFFLVFQFSIGGLLVRSIIFIYVFLGWSYLRRVKLKEIYIQPDAC